MKEPAWLPWEKEPQKQLTRSFGRIFINGGNLRTRRHLTQTPSASAERVEERWADPDGVPDLGAVSCLHREHPRASHANAGGIPECTATIWENKSRWQKKRVSHFTQSQNEIYGQVSLFAHKEFVLFSKRHVINVYSCASRWASVYRVWCMCGDERLHMNKARIKSHRNDLVSLKTSSSVFWLVMKRVCSDCSASNWGSF